MKEYISVNALLTQMHCDIKSVNNMKQNVKQCVGKAVGIFGLAFGVACLSSVGLSSCADSSDGNSGPKYSNIVPFEWSTDSIDNTIFFEMSPEGDTYILKCRNESPVLSEFLVSENNKDTLACNYCSFGEDGVPAKIVGEALPDVAICPILTNDTVIDSNDKIFEWVTVQPGADMFKVVFKANQTADRSAVLVIKSTKTVPETKMRIEFSQMAKSSN